MLYKDYQKLFKELTIGDYAKLHSTYDEDKDSFASATYLVNDKYVKAFTDKVLRRKTAELNLEVADYTEMNQDFVDPGQRFMFVNVSRELAESIFDRLNKIEEDLEGAVPTLHCENCGNELNPFGGCDICDEHKSALGEYQLTVGSSDGSLTKYDFNTFEEAHEFACGLSPDEEIAETNLAYQEAHARWTRTQE